MIYLAPSAVLAGDVTVEEGASVWHGAVLRGDFDAVVVGRDANVQDNAVLHVDRGMPCPTVPRGRCARLRGPRELPRRDARDPEQRRVDWPRIPRRRGGRGPRGRVLPGWERDRGRRSEEHTSEL